MCFDGISLGDHLVLLLRMPRRLSQELHFNLVQVFARRVIIIALDSIFYYHRGYFTAELWWMLRGGKELAWRRLIV